ncbi:Zinc finger, FLYWCH-type [Phytophthora cactorum]|nr:Zinc finger, FLYWCH-type [Phytophthora cactorum]
MQYEGHKFNLKREYLGTRYYSCAKYKKTKCLAKLVQYPLREQLSDAESDSSTGTSSTAATSEANISFRGPLHVTSQPLYILETCKKRCGNLSRKRLLKITL